MKFKFLNVYVASLSEGATISADQSGSWEALQKHAKLDWYDATGFYMQASKATDPKLRHILCLMQAGEGTWKSKPSREDTGIQKKNSRGVEGLCVWLKCFVCKRRRSMCAGGSRAAHKHLEPHENLASATRKRQKPPPTPATTRLSHSCHLLALWPVTTNCFTWTNRLTQHSSRAAGFYSHSNATKSGSSWPTIK